MEGAVRSHRDFRIRRSVVHRALNWLVTHNQYYRSNHVHIDVNALDQLPHDGNLSQLTAITVENAITEPPATNTPATGPPVADTPASSEDPYSAHLPQSFVPIDTRSMTEHQQRLRKLSLRQRSRSLLSESQQRRDDRLSRRRERERKRRLRKQQRNERYAWGGVGRETELGGLLRLWRPNQRKERLA